MQVAYTFDELQHNFARFVLLQILVFIHIITEVALLAVVDDEKVEAAKQKVLTHANQMLVVEPSHQQRLCDFSIALGVQHLRKW
jgi:hypothetical protein